MKPSASFNWKPSQLVNGPPEYSSGCRLQVNDANGAVLSSMYRRDSADQPILRRQIVLGEDHQRRRLACDGATCSWLGVLECTPWTIAARTVVVRGPVSVPRRRCGRRLALLLAVS